MMKPTEKVAALFDFDGVVMDTEAFAVLLIDRWFKPQQQMGQHVQSGETLSLDGVDARQIENNNKNGFFALSLDKIGCISE
ncbi:MAG: hypothetical protein ACI37U_01575 [Bacteroides sp.]